MLKKVLLIFITMFLLIGCSKKTEQQTETGCGTDEAQGCEIKEVTDEVLAYRELIGKFYKISYDEAYKRIENGGSLIIYYGFETCPWCQEMLPLLADYADFQIFYVNVKPDGQDSRVEGHEEYSSYLKNYELINDFKETDKIYAPTIVKIINGEITMCHAGTVDTHNAKERKMTDEEKEQLKAIIAEFFADYNGELK